MAKSSPLGRLPRELRLDIFARALTHDGDLRRPSASEKAANKRTTDLSLLTTCRAFSFEAAEVLYTSNVFQLSEADLNTIFVQTPQAHRMRIVKLHTKKPFDLYNHQSVDSKAAVAAVELLSQHCGTLQIVDIPYILSMDPYTYRSKGMFLPGTVKVGLQLARFSPPRYGFQLFLYNENIKDMWEDFLAATPEAMMIEEKVQECHDAALILKLTQEQGTVSEEELMWPATLLLGVFATAFELLDQDAAHPGEKAEF